MFMVEIKKLAKKLQVVGDASRLKILCYIFNSNNKCVSDIAKELNMSVAIVSHHLQTLAKEGLLESVRDGKRICYKLSKSEIVNDLKKFICKYK
jgi:ArsR family transcriptional regulator